MTFELNGTPLETARVSLPYYDIWQARATVTSDKALAAGSSVVLVLGDLALAGTVRSSGTFAGQASYHLVGGADGWPNACKRRSYRGDNGIRLSTVATDLASEVGERVVLETGIERVLGYAWMRAEGTAVDAIECLGVRMWMAPDGVTHLGARPARALPGRLQLVVERYDPAAGMVRIGSPDDAYAALLPGVTFAAEGISFVVSDLQINVSPGSVTAEVWA